MRMLDDVILQTNSKLICIHCCSHKRCQDACVGTITYLEPRKEIAYFIPVVRLYGCLMVPSHAIKVLQHICTMF